MLGTLIAVSNGRSVAPRGTMRHRVLAVLLSRANHIVPTEVLIDAAWNGAPPATAAKTLQSHIVRIRDAVDPDRKILQTMPPGYLLEVDPHDLDVLQFEQMVARARKARQAGVPESAAAMLADALALWRGPAYEDLRDCDYLARAAAQVDDLRQTALESRIDADLACGRGPELVTELAVAVAAHPFREALWRHFAVALYRSDRQADALAALREVRRSLRIELGVDPGPELQLVERAILSHEPGLKSAPVGAAAGGQLPPVLAADTWPMAGREPELHWLGQAWSETARSRGGLVVLRGPAGIGRSRLLAEFARSVSSRGVTVRYASGPEDGDLLGIALRSGGLPLRWSASAADVVGAVRRTAELAPTLVVLDDLDRCAYAVPAAIQVASSPLAARSAANP